MDIALLAAGLAESTPDRPFPPDPEMPAYTLPEPLRTADGRPIATTDDWRQIRRPELLELFRQHVSDKPVAAVIYSRARHLINVFSCPQQGDGSRAQVIARHGFNAVGWSEAGMQYWAVADIDREELERFAGSLRVAHAD